jgi:hypothetical protein
MGLLKNLNLYFCTIGKAVTGMKRKLTEWEKTFARYISDKGLTNRIYWKLKNYTSKESMTQ